MISDLQQLSTRIPDLGKFGACCRRRVSTAGGWFLFRNRPAGPYFLHRVCCSCLRLSRSAFPQNCLHRLDESGFYYGSTCLRGGPHDLLLSGHHPYGIVGRLFGKDFLSEKLDPNAKSYWLVRDRSRIRKPVDYEQQY